MPTDDPPPRAPEPITCAEAFELSRTFAAEELSRERTLLLRTHLARCPECMASYREAITTAASLGRVNQQAREQRAVEQQRRELHAKAFGHSGAGSRPRKRSRIHYLRLVLIPAVFIYIMTQVVGFGPPPAKVRLVEATGLVSLDQRSVELGGDPLLVLPGRWVTTRRYARARLDALTATITLEGETELLVESAKPPRFRLRAGGVLVEGTTSLVTLLGLIEVEEGKGRLRLDERGLSVEPESGGWKRLDKGGERALEKGRTTVFTP